MFGLGWKGGRRPGSELGSRSGECQPEGEGSSGDWVGAGHPTRAAGPVGHPLPWGPTACVPKLLFHSPAPPGCWPLRPSRLRVPPDQYTFDLKPLRSSTACLSLGLF